MKITLAQIPLSDKLDENIDKHLSIILKTDSDLIVFPELSLTSYSETNLKKYKKDNSDIINAINNIAITVSKSNTIVILGAPIVDGTHMFNSAVIIRDVDNIIYYHKNYLTGFDKRYFERGSDICSFRVLDESISVVLCRDQSHNDLFERIIRRFNPTIIIIMSAHYYQMEISKQKKDKNIAIPIVRAIDNNVFVAKVNAIGCCDGKFSNGNSLVVNPFGVVIENAFDKDEFYLTFNK